MNADIQTFIGIFTHLRPAKITIIRTIAPEHDKLTNYYRSDTTMVGLQV